MSFPELAVLNALNMLQRPAPGEPGKWIPVTAQEVTRWLRQEASGMSFMEGCKYRPTKHQVRWVLSDLAGRVNKYHQDRRIKEPFVEVIEGEPNGYRLTDRAVKLMIA